MVDPHLLSAYLFRELKRHPSSLLFHHISFASLIGLSVYPEIAHEDLLVWAGLILTASTWQWLLFRRSTKDVEQAVKPRDIDSITMASISVGLCFGFSAFFLPSLNASSQLFVMIMLSVIAASELFRLSAFPRIYVMFLIGLITPLIFVISMLDSVFDNWQLVPAVLLMALSLYYSAMLRRRDLTDDLIARFSLENVVGEDKLTGIANRRRFDLVLEQVWAQARRSSAPVSMIMIDIDYFKKFNDTYGHQEGDKCLAAVAKAINKQTKRATDLAARYGGEEFVILLNHTPRDPAYEIAEKMRKAVEALQIQHRQSPHGNVTISLGGVTLFARQDSNDENPIKLADQALYQAKERGRNCIVWQQSER